MGFLAKSYIQNYIKQSTSTTIQNRGRQIFKGSGWQLVQYREEEDDAEFLMPSSNGFDEYTVNLYKVSSDAITSSCDCPYDWGPMCKHEVAALMALEDEYESIIGKKQPRPVQPQKDTVTIEKESANAEIVSTIQTEGDNTSHVKLGKISHLMNYANTNAKMVNKGETLFRCNYTQNLTIADAKVQVRVFDGVSYQKVTFERINNEQLQATCTCKRDDVKLCEHKIAALLHVRKIKGEFFFEQLRDHSAVKKELLAEYGYDIEDNIEDKFQFSFRNGKLELKLLDPTIQKLSGEKEWTTLTNYINRNRLNAKIFKNNNEETSFSEDWEVGYGFYFALFKEIPDVQTVRVVGVTDVKRERFKSNLKDYNDLDVGMVPNVNEEGLRINHLLKKVSKASISQQMSGNSKYVIYGRVSDKAFLESQEYLFKHFSKLLPLLENKITGELRLNHRIKISNFSQFYFKTNPVSIAFTLEEKESFLYLSAYLFLNNERYDLSYLQRKSYLFLANKEDNVFMVDSVETANLISAFSENPTLKIGRSDFLAFYQKVLKSLMRRYEVDLNMALEIKQKQGTLKKRIYIEEADDFLVLTPKVTYNKIDVYLYGNEQIITQGKKNKLIEIIRDEAAEDNFKIALEGLHTNFKEQSENGNFYFIHISEILKNDWFFNTFDFFREAEIEVFGFDQLSNLKYNSNRASFDIVASSGIDWFDVKIKVAFGKQIVDLKAIQQAIQRNENFVRLDDGTLGLLPEEWIKKNAMLFKMGNVKKDVLEVSKLHFSLLDTLFEELDQEEIAKELRTKKSKLLNFEEIGKHEVPANIKAELRDYQTSGYNWMRFLHEFGWGGCLADDMGLGKTLQILTFLQSQIDEHPDKTNLVIVPTSLIFNWADEIKKFAPTMQYLIHRGGDRTKDMEEFKKHNLIITTYGILVRDIELLDDFVFHYVILDESQAIKNPNSKRYKAVRLLKAYNRLVLTGTPVENNSFDLYAQMNFLNPGLLGSMRFFKDEFSKPIDREGDKEKVAQLKKMVFPFLLRRTKEQVATELPEKTESVLFCEMGTEQKKVYESYRKLYRDRIIKKVADEGLNKSHFFVLEALLKLRQICDSPALVNNDEQVFENNSIKIDTLMEHVMEKTGDHKILVFSQFVSMLKLIRERLDAGEVVYEYLDGGTKPKDRAESVKRFQSDDNIRVFVISLKAGGVGLNLTEADYVYLVDPWWNPAVEAQAIDRTHRIGQTRKVFSYKMICKDTIEEKVLKLQDKKKGLVTDLISSEGNFYKSLNKNDIEELFS